MTILQIVIPVAIIALIGWLQLLVDRLADDESSSLTEKYGHVDISDFRFRIPGYARSSRVAW